MNARSNKVRCAAQAVVLAVVSLVTLHGGRVSGNDVIPTLRPPSVPLVACDPYFSVWSSGDRLTDVDTTHWTGRSHRLTSVVRIDGRAHRVMGTEPASIPPLPQTQVQVLPTRTVCQFEGQGIRLTLTFLTPALPEDIDLLSRPVTYVDWEVMSLDGKGHEVEVWFDASPELAVNDPRQVVEYASPRVRELHVLRVGSTEQPVLRKRGDDLRIDWGHLYVAVPTSGGSVIIAGDTQADRAGFVEAGASRRVLQARAQDVSSRRSACPDLVHGLP